MSKIYRDLKEKLLTIKEASSQIITIVLNDDLEINYELKDGDYKILIFNNADKEISLIENGQLINASVEINYLELNPNNFKQVNQIEVLANSSLVINSTYLGIKDKQINFMLINKESDSYIKISNNVVCLADANFLLNVAGKIVKGAKRSKCFQKSRCLTFENPEAAKILPILEIDENDVEASHSLSSGTIDQDVMFYMNSRGLNVKEALALILVSYLMPDEHFYEEYKEGLKIKEIADKKVEKICMM